MMERISREDPPSPEEAAFFRVIEERFCALRGAPMLLSPRDWALISDWWGDGVPLPLVLESLEEVFTARARRGDSGNRINSLAYARPEILRRFRLHREMTSPRRTEGEETERLRGEIRRHLGRVARSLKEAGAVARGRGWTDLANSLTESTATCRSLRKSVAAIGWNPAEAELSLEALDAALLVAARSALEESSIRRIEEETSRILEPRRAMMTEGAYRGTIAAMESRRIRAEFGIPRLSFLVEG